MRRQRETDQSERAEQCAGGHDHMAAMAVDQSADRRRAEPGDQQGERETAHRKKQRPAALGRDQRHHQDRRIKQRAPGENLRHAENGDGAPGTENEFAEFWH